MTKRVANRKDQTPEAKVKVSGCGTLHKPEKPVLKCTPQYLNADTVQIPGSELATNAID